MEKSRKQVQALDASIEKVRSKAVSLCVWVPWAVLWYMHIYSVVKGYCQWKAKEL